MKNKLKKKRIALFFACLLLLTLLSFSFPVQADGKGIIEVRVTFRGIWPVTNADVWGENINTHEIIESYYHPPTRRYYIYVEFEIGQHQTKDIKVTVDTKMLGIQDDIVYDLTEFDYIQLHFDFESRERSRPLNFEVYRNFPLLIRLFQFPFIKGLLGL